MENSEKVPAKKKEIIIKKKVNNGALTGLVTIAMLSYPERIRISQESLTEIAPGEDEKSFTVKANQDLARAQAYYELAIKQVRTIDITIVENDEKLTSIDELMVYEKGTELVMEIASDLIGGVKLGNEKSPISDKIA